MARNMQCVLNKSVVEEIKKKLRYEKIEINGIDCQTFLKVKLFIFH